MVNMKSLCIFACVVVAVASQQYSLSQLLNSRYPKWDIEQPHDRYRRQLTVDKQTGDVTLGGNVGEKGRLFGTLGNRGEAMFGKAGYTHNIFDKGGNAGKLDATAYGARVLSPYGNSNHLGGRLDWSNDRLYSSVDVRHQIHGLNRIDAAAGGKWPIGKNADVSLGGTYTRMGPLQDYGVQAGLGIRF